MFHKIVDKIETGLEKSAALMCLVLLVCLLSWRARRAEQETLYRLGGTPGATAALMLAEVGMVLLTAVVLASLLALLTHRFGDPLLKAVVM